MSAKRKDAPEQLCFSIQETADILGVSKNWLQMRIMKDGRLRSFKIGQRRFFNREAIDEFRFALERQQNDGPETDNI